MRYYLPIETMKKLLLLGGIKYLLPVIRAAHEVGAHVITCDYLPDNIAHKYSDEYHNVSIVDKQAVLRLAERLKIDGIMSFATDPGVETAAYVAQQLGLPSCGSYDAVHILQNKDLFRAFLRQNNFAVPFSQSYTDPLAARADAKLFRWPVIVKPTDSAGSKGVTKVDDVAALEQAARYALSYSQSGTYIVEEFIEKAGYSSDADSFSIDGRLVYCAFNNQFFDEKADNPYTPAAYSWPSTMADKHLTALRAEIQRLITLLGLGTSIYNIETRVGVDGVPYIMELSPRGGGNRLAEVQRLATGEDLIKAAVCAALGMPVHIGGDCVFDGYWAEVILHANSEGAYRGVAIAPSLQPYVVEVDEWVALGTHVHPFTGANQTVGTVVLRFDAYDRMQRTLSDIDAYITVQTQA